MTKEQEKNLVEGKIKYLFTDQRINEFLPFFCQFKIINRPNVIWELLILFEHFEHEEIKSLILNELQACLEHFPLNSLTLAAKTAQRLPNNKKQSVLESFIKLALKFAETNSKTSEDLLNVIGALCKNNKLERSQLNQIYSHLSQRFYEQTLNSDIIYYSLRMLHKILINQNPKFDEPQSFFYFTGIGSGLKVNQTSAWLFSTGFGIGVWFYLEEANGHVHDAKEMHEYTGKACPKLFTIHCQGSGGIEAYFIGNNLHYRNLSTNYSEPAQGSNGSLVGVFQPKTWYYVGLEHERQKIIGRSHLNIVINTEQKKSISIEFPKIASNVAITKFVIGENLIGRIASVVIFKTPINQLKLTELNSLFSLGIQTNNTIRNLGISMEKLLDRIFLLYTPIRASGDICYDIFGNYHGVLQETAGYINKDYTQFRFGALGGVTSILPFFYLLSTMKKESYDNPAYLGFVDNEKHPNVLDELLKIIVLLFRNKPENQFEALKVGFFKVMGQLLAETGKNFFSSESVELLAEIKNCLINPKLTEEMFTGVLWKTELYDKTTDEFKTHAFKYIRTIYLQNGPYYFALFSVKNIMDLLVDKYDEPFKKKAVTMKSEWSSMRTPEFPIAEKTFEPVLSIVEVALFTGGDVAVEAINNIVNLMTAKCSPYLHIVLLTMLKDCITKREDFASASKSYIKLLSETRATKNLVYLMTNTHCLDLKALCIKFLNILTKYSPNPENEALITHYISGIIWSATTHHQDQLASYNRFSIRPSFSKTENPNEKRKSALEAVRRGSANIPATSGSSGSLDELKHPTEIIKSARMFISPRKTQSEAWSLQEIGNLDMANEKTPNRKSTTMSLDAEQVSGRASIFKEQRKKSEETLNDSPFRIKDASELEKQENQVEETKVEEIPEEETPKAQEESEENTPKAEEMERLSSLENENKPTPAYKAKSLRKKPNLKPIPINQDPDSAGKENSQQEASNSSITPDLKTILDTKYSPIVLTDSPQVSEPVPENNPPAQSTLDATQISQVKSEEENIADTAESLTGVTHEILYNSLLEWLLQKKPAPIGATVMIDDSDKITSPSVILIMIKFYKHATEEVRQRMIQDLYMLVKWNSANCTALLGIPELEYFLLDVLYINQLTLFTEELKAIPAAIWELGVKTHTMLKKFALLNQPESHQRMQTLFTWIQNKKIVYANKPNKELHEKAAYFLVRHLWLNFLESVEDSTNVIYPFSHSNLWNNIIQVAFYTEEIISSAVDSGLPRTSRFENGSDSFSALRSLIIKAKSLDDVPLNYQVYMLSSNWIDLKICEALIKTISPLWTKFTFQKFKEDEKLNQTQKLEKKLNLLMDGVQAEEQSKLFEWFFTESKEKEIPNRGCLLKIIVQILCCFAEEAVRNNNLERTTFACQQIESLLIFLMIVGENVREKYFSWTRKSFITASILSLLQILYKLEAIAPEDSEIKQAIIGSTRGVIMHLMCIAYYINQRTGKFESLGSNVESVVGSPKEIYKQSFTLITYDIISTYLASEQEPLINIQVIKVFKSNDFADITSMITTADWMNVVVNSEKINQLIGEHYPDNLDSITSEVSRALEDLSTSRAINNYRFEKKREDSERKFGIEILETALEVYEQENEKRQENLANDEESVRMAKGTWKNIWKRMRVYVGLWKHPSLYDQEDFKFNAEKESYNAMVNNTLFSHKISKYETRSHARPFIKIKLIEPAYVEQYNTILVQRRGDIRSMVNNLRPTVFLNQNYAVENPNSANKKFSFTGIGKNLKKTFKAIIPNQSGSQPSPFKVDSTFSPMSSGQKASFESPSVKPEIFVTKRCQWIRTLTIRNGFFQISTNKFSFIIEGFDQKENHIAFLKYSLPDFQTISKEWPLESIEEIQKRRFIFRKSGLEIMLTDGSTLLFNFSEADAEEVSSTLIKLRKPKCPNLLYYGTLDPRKVVDKSGLTKRWQNYEISNFEYIMRLNELSGRSYKDLTQYPVFPWVLSNYIADTIRLNNPTFYRDLSKTMGALGSQERINTYIERFENTDTFDPVPPFHFGSHYSSPAIILQYLVRLAPFTQGAIQLQSGRFDLADRLFYSMSESYRGATEEIADVRELLPEFYCLPDFLINREKLDFGVTQYGLRVHHITTPDWSNNNPYLFVSLLREALESEIVSRNLHNWIDLIFGYKQTGKEAEKALNVYFYMTYEDKVDLAMLEDPSTKISYESQIVHFGQTPTQLFFKPHPQRPPLDYTVNTKIIAESLHEVNIYRPNKAKREEKDKIISGLAELNKSTSALIKIMMISDNKVVTFRKDGKVVFYKWTSSTTNNEFATSGPFKCVIEKEKYARLDRGKFDYFDHSDASVTYLSYPITFMNNGKFVVSGGYWDGRLTTYSVETDSVADIYHNHNDTITTIVTDEKEEYLISGSKSGECIVWKIVPETTKLSIKFQYFDHEDMINQIFISYELRLFATAGNDGRVNIYHFVSGQLIRTIYHPSNLPVDMVVLSSSPLPSVVFFSSEDRTLYSYSINGRLLETSSEDYGHALSPIIIRNLNFMELLVYGNEKGEVFVRELPFLELRKRWEISARHPIFNLVLSKDSRHLFVGCGDGDFVVLTNPTPLTQTTRRVEEDPNKSLDESK